MGRGIDASLDWPVIKELLNGDYLVDTGSRLRVRQRKRFKLKKDAESFAAQIRKVFSFDGKGALSEQQKNEYRLAVSSLGDQYKKVNLVDVVSFYLRMQGVSAISKTVREAVPLFIRSREFRDDKRLKKKPRSKRYMAQLDLVLTEFSGKFGDRKPADITKDELDEFINGTRLNKRDPSKEIAETTRHNLYRAVCAFYNYCWKQKWIIENPMEYVDAPEPAALNPKILTIEQSKELLDFVADKHNDMLGFFALSLFCGIRVQELCRMKISDLRMTSYSGKYCVIVSPEVAKKGRPRKVEMPYNCFVWLQHWLSQARIPVSKNQWKNRRELVETDRIVPVSESSIFYRTKLIAKESKIVLPQNVLRHSFASYYFATTKDAEQTRSRLGHETKQILFKHYAQLVGDEKPAVDYFKILPADMKWKDLVHDFSVKDYVKVIEANNTDTFRLLNLL